MFVSIFAPQLVPIGKALLLRWQWTQLLNSGGKRRVGCTFGSFGASRYAALLHGEAIDLPARLATALNCVLVTYAFSTGLPLLNVFAALAFFVAYWCDKMLFLYHFRAPPIESAATVAAMLELIPWAVVLHFGVGAWMLGSLDVAVSLDVTGAGAGPGGAALQTTANDASSAPGVVSLYDDGRGLAFHVDGLRLASPSALQLWFLNASAPSVPAESVQATVSRASLLRVLSPAAEPLAAAFAVTLALLVLALLLRVFGAGAEVARRALLRCSPTARSLLGGDKDGGEEQEDEDDEEEDEEEEEKEGWDEGSNDGRGARAAGDEGRGKKELEQDREQEKGEEQDEGQKEGQAEEQQQGEETEESAQARSARAAAAARGKRRILEPIFSVATAAGAANTPLALVGAQTYDMLAHVLGELHLDPRALAAAGRGADIVDVLLAVEEGHKH